MNAPSNPGEREEWDADHYYLRMQMLLFELCRDLPALRLAAFVSNVAHMREETFLEDLRITGLDDFVRNLSLELVSRGNDADGTEDDP